MRTTIDDGLQRFVQAQTQPSIGALGPHHVSDGAAIVVDNHTGDVLAYVGSPDYFSDAALGRNDGVQALRQPGSSLKPFTYELALENGTILSTTILPDVPETYALPGGKLYAAGRLQRPFQRARARALRAGQLAQRSGRARALVARRRAAARSGCTSWAFRISTHPAEYYGLGLTLGSGEVSLWELTRAYATMAHGGGDAPLRLIAARPPRGAARSSAIVRPGCS